MHRKLSFIVTDEPNPVHTRTIMELCDYLTDRMLAPRLLASGARWEHAWLDFFSFDNTCDPLQPVGTIFFRIPPLFAGCAASLQAAVVQELGKLGIKTGRIIEERDAHDPHGPVLRIPVLENPTVATQPPEVNMSKTRGLIVLRDLLGFQPVDGRYVFDASDLIRRVDDVRADQIAACISSPVRDPLAGTLQVRPSLVSERAVRRCLEEIREFAEWAVEHNYEHLAAA